MQGKDWEDELDEIRNSQAKKREPFCKNETAIRDEEHGDADEKFVENSIKLLWRWQF